MYPIDFSRDTFPLLHRNHLLFNDFLFRVIFTRLGVLVFVCIDTKFVLQVIYLKPQVFYLGHFNVCDRSWVLDTALNLAEEVVDKGYSVCGFLFEKTGNKLFENQIVFRSNNVGVDLHLCN